MPTWNFGGEIVANSQIKSQASQMTQASQEIPFEFSSLGTLFEDSEA